MSSKSGAAGEIKKIESEKHHEIQPLKTDTLTVSTFDAVIHVHDESKHYLSHRFAQRRYHFTQFISNRLSLSFVFGVRGSEIFLGRTLCVLKCFITSIGSVVKNRLSLSSKLYSSHCGTSLHQAPIFYFMAKCLGSF